MTTEKMIALAEREGFCGAAVTHTSRIAFDSAFRPYCEENLCGQYGANYSCPPACGTPEEMKERVLSYPKVLVLKSECEVENFQQREKLLAGKTWHNDAMFRLIEELRKEGHEGFMIGASGCSICKPCAMAKGEPCKFPELRYSCMSAYCIHVKRLAQDCGMKYDYENGILPYFGVYVFR